MMGTSVLVGFFEEIPYRGFMLQHAEGSLFVGSDRGA
jgi:hypothetical protein